MANRGEFEVKAQNKIKEAGGSEPKDYLVYRRNTLHYRVVCTNAAILTKPALAHGNLRLLGATTISEYRCYIEKDAARERRFQPLDMVEPTMPETIDIINRLLPNCFVFYGVEYTSDAVAAALPN